MTWNVKGLGHALLKIKSLKKGSNDWQQRVPNKYRKNKVKYPNLN